MNDDKLSEVVNRSGFPLQIGLENYVNKTNESHGWNVIFSEHSWKNQTDGTSGFIDLVLEDRHQTSVLIIESKRVLETSWVFLIDNNKKSKQLNRHHAKSWVLYFYNDYFRYFGLEELTLSPVTAQSQYCVVDGQNSKSRPMLERIGADVVSSMEGFANEEKERCLNGERIFRMYFSVIVTTAKLKLCSFDATEISIQDGKIQDAQYEEVPYLRFRKQLSSHYKALEDASFYDYNALARAKESTVFVVNAEALPEFLEEFEVDKHSLSGII